MNITPSRLQLRRVKGFDLQALSRATNGLEAVNCARPGKWGNPFHVDVYKTPRACVTKYRALLNVADKLRAAAVAQLRGKNLACFCRPEDPCHVDVLLEIANG